MLDKRRFTRKKSVLHVTCQTVEEPYSSIKAQSLAISQSGMELRLKKHFSARKMMRVTITNPCWKEPIIAKCRIVWEKSMPGTDEKKIAVEFLDIPWNRINQLMGGIKG